MDVDVKEESIESYTSYDAEKSCSNSPVPAMVTLMSNLIKERLSGLVKSEEAETSNTNHDVS